MRLFSILSGVVFPCILWQPLFAETPSVAVQIVKATYRLENPSTSGTGFVLRRNHGDESELLLVTAAHAFEKMQGDTMTLVSRSVDPEDNWTAVPTQITIRQNDKPHWHRHDQQDVAVLRLPLDAAASVESIPLDLLATPEDWSAKTPNPGDLVRCVGFPHAAQFKPSKAGFPLTRVGCVASYPLLPLKSNPTFLVDYNAFEGDSGGPVYIEQSKAKQPVIKILGLVHAQHFIDEKYTTIYQKGEIRKRLGMAIIANSQVIRETIDSLPERTDDKSTP